MAPRICTKPQTSRSRRLSPAMSKSRCWLSSRNRRCNLWLGSLRLVRCTGRRNLSAPAPAPARLSDLGGRVFFRSVERVLLRAMCCALQGLDSMSLPGEVPTPSLVPDGRSATSGVQNLRTPRSPHPGLHKGHVFTTSSGQPPRLKKKIPDLCSAVVLRRLVGLRHLICRGCGGWFAIFYEHR